MLCCFRWVLLHAEPTDSDELKSDLSTESARLLAEFMLLVRLRPVGLDGTELARDAVSGGLDVCWHGLSDLRMDLEVSDSDWLWFVVSDVSRVLSRSSVLKLEDLVDCMFSELDVLSLKIAIKLNKKEIDIMIFD